MKDLIRWGIWGTGTVAQAFGRGLARVPGTQLVAVVSRNFERAQLFAESFGVERCYQNASEMLSDSTVDVVYIATPNHLHKEHSLAAIDAGKAVLCEKPFALTASEAREVVLAAQHQQVFCMEAMWMRFMPLIKRARRLLLDGGIGKVLGLTADFALPLVEDLGAAAWKKETGGGALLDRGIYCLSLASLLLGEPEQVSSTATTTSSGVDATSSYTLKYRSGAFAVLWASQRAQGTNQAVVFGTKSNLCVHEPFIRPHRVTLAKVREPAVPNRSEPREPGSVQRLRENPLVQHVTRRAKSALVRPEDSWFEPVPGTGYQFEADEVTRCLRAGLRESPDMPLAETVRVLELADEIRRGWSTSGEAR